MNKDKNFLEMFIEFYKTHNIDPVKHMKEEDNQDYYNVTIMQLIFELNDKVDKLTKSTTDALLQISTTLDEINKRKTL
jgi:hypothetical protein